MSDSKYYRRTLIWYSITAVAYAIVAMLFALSFDGEWWLIVISAIWMLLFLVYSYLSMLYYNMLYMARIRESIYGR